MIGSKHEHTKVFYPKIQQHMFMIIHSITGRERGKGNNHKDCVQQNGFFYKIATSPKLSQFFNVAKA